MPSVRPHWQAVPPDLTLRSACSRRPTQPLPRLEQPDLAWAECSELTPDGVSRGSGVASPLRSDGRAPLDPEVSPVDRQLAQIGDEGPYERGSSSQRPTRPGRKTSR